MQLNGLLITLPRDIKLVIGLFLIVLSIGFYTGLLFVSETTSANPLGIEQQYLGNENDEEAVIMKFKKSEKEILSIVHSHMLSMSIIFFLLGIILSLTRLNKKVKLFLMIEPFFSVILTFGGIYFLWRGILWMKYVVMFSGMLMTVTYSLIILIILIQLCQKQKVIN